MRRAEDLRAEGMAPAVRDAAYRASAAGLAVLPPREDGSKAPIAPWQNYKAPDEKTLEGWYGDGQRQGLGIVTGIDGVEALDFDNDEIYEAYRELAVATGLGDLMERIEAGFLEATPKGRHWLYRCDTISSNTKLARRVRLPELRKHPNDVVETLIETRGRGGYVVVAPSCGLVHESGESYCLLRGGFDTIITITTDERHELHELARSFDSLPKPEAGPSPQRSGASGDRPGDAYAASVSWGDVLTPHGWAWCYRRGDVDYWRRPGKDKGISATTNYAASDLLYVFTSSSLFEPEHSYTKFAAYAMLEHDGDYPAAARVLASLGFGKATTGTTNGTKPGGEGVHASTPAPTEAVRGGEWIFERPPPPPAIWGEEERILWRAGEPATIYGPVGVGKTTLIQQVILGLCGVRDKPLLGLPLTRRGRVLYLALDRPLQAVQSMARMVAPADRDALNDYLVVWDRGLPFDLANEEPGRLLEWCREICPDVDTVILDGLYLAAAELEKPAVAARVNLAFQALVREGIEILVGHHPKKLQAGARPKSLDQMFGGVWLAAGMGSIMLLWGEGGDIIVEFSQLKSPRETVGPFKVIHDHDTGTTTIQGELDVLKLVRQHNGISAPDTARFIYDTTKPSDNQVERARRQLQSLVKKGLAQASGGTQGGSGGGTPTLYYATQRLQRPEGEHAGEHAPSQGQNEHATENRARGDPEANLKTEHATEHGEHGQSEHESNAPLRGVLARRTRSSNSLLPSSIPAAQGSHRCIDCGELVEGFDLCAACELEQEAQ